MQNSELYDALLKAETEEEVDEVLKRCGYWDYDLSNWFPVDDDTNNWARAGNLNSAPTGASSKN